MKRLHSIVILLALITSGAGTAFSQDAGQNISTLLDALPPGLTLKEDGPQRYSMVAEYHNKALLGGPLGKMRVSGEYTRGLEGGYVRWDKVEIAETYQEGGDFPAGKAQAYMEGFRYIPSENMVEAAAFGQFPPTPNSTFAKNLVWDALCFETFAWEFLDKLQLNVPYRAEEVEGEIPLAGQGTFENKEAYVAWTGISRMNGELCALIQFKVMDNPLKMDNEQMDIRGRSHYWGDIWVSLEDKQIEHATLSEDVVMEIKLAGQPNGQYINTTREIVFRKLSGLRNNKEW